jgi:flagellar hook-length control protein FliK
MMAAPTTLRVGAAPGAAAGTSGEPTNTGATNFLSLLAAATAGAEPVAVLEGGNAGKAPQESSKELAPEGLAQLFPTLFAAIVQVSGDSGARQGGSEAGGEGPVRGAHGALHDALLCAAGSALPEAGDALQEGLLARISAEISAGADLSDPAQDVLHQLTQAITGEAAPAARLPSGSELGVVAAAGSAASTSASLAASAPAMEQALRTAVGTPRWSEELASRLVVMSSRGQHEGSLTLTPEHLGPLEVRISINQNTANVWFGAQHADTRAALAEAMPRLRELFSEAGLSLGQAGVSQETPRRSASDATPGQGSFSGESDAAEALVAPVVVRHLGSALVDLYA